MSIKAIIDSVEYNGVEKITTGGKEVNLEEAYSGSLNITENGTYDVGGKARVEVEVPQSGITPSGSVTFTENGNYDVTDKATVIVAVQGSEGLTYEDVAGYFIPNNTDLVLATKTSVRNGAYWGSSGIKTVSAPNCETLGNYAFASCTNITSYNLPLCESIGDYALWQNNKLASINLAVCTSLGKFAFFVDTALTSVNLPEVVTVGESAFNGCSNLASIVLPKAKTFSISGFSNCSLLAFADIGGEGAKFTNTLFNGCSALTTIVLRSSTKVTATVSTFGSAGNTVERTIYVPQALISEYEADSVWSRWADTITFAAIEGSEYDV